jgi:hypothetical protein
MRSFQLRILIILPSANICRKKPNKKTAELVVPQSDYLPVNTLHFFCSFFLTLACISRIPSAVPGFNFFSLFKAVECGIIETVMQFVSESSSGNLVVARNFSIQAQDSTAMESMTFWL